MKIIDLFKSKKPVVAFEVFPPKPDVPVESIYEHLDKFGALKPDYFSVTYGAGGSQKGRTIEIASRIKNTLGIESMAHFTCMGQNAQDVDKMLSEMHTLNLDNILALRGDPPIDQPDFDYSKNTFQHASDLISYIRKNNDFCIAAAAYVEGHVDADRISKDLEFLKLKVDAGVDLLITQLFFDNRLFYNFIEEAAAKGINCPISAGVMPIFKADQIKSICSKSGCSIPAKLVLMMDKYSDNPDDLRKAGIEYAAEQIRGLIDNGAEGIHLYTMNRPKSTKEILEAAGLM